jgi:hypothetical protein
MGTPTLILSAACASLENMAAKNETGARKRAIQLVFC